MELLEYQLSKGVRAFSTLRTSEELGKGAYASFMASPYLGFNITPYCGDAPEHVEKCRHLLAEELGIPEDRIVLPTQTHTNNIAIVDESYWTLDIRERAERLQNIDALITQQRGVCIGVSTADCVPILFYDEKHQCIAAVHAGWRGVVGHIARRTILKMQELGCEPNAIQVVVAPSIAPNSFEVGDEVVSAFEEAGFPSSVILKQFAKPHIDLWAAVAFDLESAGISLQNIQIAGVDTYEHADSFFSARRLGIESGRIFNGILLQ